MNTRVPARGDLLPSAIISLLGRAGTTSRADIARALNVSPAAVTQVTKHLVARGLVAEVGRAPSQGGRPARLLGLVQSAGGAIGAKVAADHVAIVDASIDGTVQRFTSHRFDPWAANSLDELARLLGTARDIHEGPLLGIGVGVPGSVDAQALGVVNAPTLGWADVRVGHALRSALRVPVLVENDVNTLAVAERLYGTGRYYASALVVTIGRGIGCGILVDGAIYRGAAGGAGEIGHIPVSDDGPLCGCGSTGCLEAYAGDAALVRQAQERRVIGPDDDQRSLVAAAAKGDEAARAIYADAGGLLGRVLAGVIHTVDPEVVVMLGEGIEAWPFWQPAFEQSLRRHLTPSRRDLPIVVEPWADDKWALGAAALVLSSPFDAVGASGDQGRLVRARLQAGTADLPALERHPRKEGDHLPH